MQVVAFWVGFNLRYTHPLGDAHCTECKEWEKLDTEEGGEGEMIFAPLHISCLL